MYTINLLTIQFSLWYSPPTEALKFKREKKMINEKKKNKQTKKICCLQTCMPGGILAPNPNAG